MSSFSAKVQDQSLKTTMKEKNIYDGENSTNSPIFMTDESFSKLKSPKNPLL